MKDDAATTLVRVEPLYLEKPAAAAYLAMSISTFEELGRTDPTFPQARLLSPRRTGYLLSELRAWGQDRPVSTLPPPPNTGARKPRNPGARRGSAAPAAQPSA